MADEQQPVGEAEATPEGSPPVAPTAEQVEAEYKARLSGKDKAHAAETAALRSQIAALEASSKDSTQRTVTENDAIKAELDNTKRLLAETQRIAVIETRTARFPNAAEALEADVLAAMDEAKLAGLEARLAPTPAGMPMLASSTPAKASAATKPLTEKTVAELEADLSRYGPQFEREISGR